MPKFRNPFSRHAQPTDASPSQQNGDQSSIWEQDPIAAARASGASSAGDNFEGRTPPQVASLAGDRFVAVVDESAAQGSSLLNGPVVSGGEMEVDAGEEGLFLEGDRIGDLGLDAEFNV